MTDLDALHRAILNHPDDDTTRLIYADALEDVGESRRAAFIRAQVELARLPEYDPFWVKCRYHDRGELVTGAPWLLQLPDLPEGLDWTREPFRRGFPAAVRADNGSVFVRHAGELFTLAPVECLEIPAVRASETELSRCHWLGRLTRLALTHGVSQLVVRRLLNSPHFERLTDLHVGAGLTTAGATQAVFGSQAFRRLKSFSCREDRPSQAVITGLARLADPPRLKKLDLSENRTTSEAVARLMGAPILEAVEELNLSDNNLGAEGVRAVAAARLPRLRSLHLMRVRLEETGVRALTESDFLAEVRSLTLGGNNLGPSAAALLAASRTAANLRVLDLRDNRLGDWGAASLANSSHLANLLHLDLAGNLIEDAGANALAEAPHLGGLIALDLTSNVISAPAAARLRDRFGERVFL